MPINGGLKVYVLRLIIMVLLTMTLAPQSWAGKRLALIIGNAEYSGKSLVALKNPVNDAVLMSDSLKKTGFEIDLLQNADLRAMKKIVATFAKKVKDAGPDAVALFYYSGHGFQANNINYLAPLKAELQDEVDAEFEALSVDWVLARLETAHKGANIVILDACRNTALSRSASAGGGAGLALLKSTPIGSFISYSTAPGSTALDGTGINSPYTAAIARELIQPGTTIEQVFKNVRRSVVSETDGDQVPWDYSSLTSDIVFVPIDDPEAVARAVGKTNMSEMQVDLQLWNDVKNSGSADAIQSYLKRFPDGAFATLAQARVDALSGNTTSSEQIEVLFAKLTNRSLIVEKPTRPHEFYANARMREIQGDYPKARQDYLKFFAFGEDKVDPHYRFQAFLRVQEGRAGAREFYTSLSQGNRNPTLQFATALLSERVPRIDLLRTFINDNPDFGPAYYELSRDYSLARLGQQSLADKKSEHALLNQFVGLVEDGKLLRFFFDQQMAALQVEDAKQRLAALSFLDNVALENPVKLNATRSNQGWMLNLSIADQATEIFVAHSGKSAASTGFMPGALHPQTGKPLPFPMIELPGHAKSMSLEVTYLDIRGEKQGPFTVNFDPDAALVSGQKAILDQFSTAWISYRLYDGKLLAYFTHLVSYRCAIDSVEYGIDSNVPSTVFQLDKCDPLNPHSVDVGNDTSKILISLPKKTKFMTVKLTYKDGTQSGIKRFENVQ